MNRDARPTWTETELRGLLASYFGDKLEPSQLDELVAAASDALVARGRGAPAARLPDLDGRALRA